MRSSFIMRRRARMSDRNNTLIIKYDQVVSTAANRSTRANKDEQIRRKMNSSLCIFRRNCVGNNLFTHCETEEGRREREAKCCHTIFTWQHNGPKIKQEHTSARTFIISILLLMASRHETHNRSRVSSRFPFVWQEHFERFDLNRIRWAVKLYIVRAPAIYRRD